MCIKYIHSRKESTEIYRTYPQTTQLQSLRRKVSGAFVQGNSNPKPLENRKQCVSPNLKRKVNKDSFTLDGTVKVVGNDQIQVPVIGRKA